MQFAKINGLVAAPFTPMHRDGSINLNLIPDYHTLLKRNKVAGAFICGSTGEGVSLTVEEKKAVAEAWAHVNVRDPSFSVITLVGGNSIAEAKLLAAHAEKAGLSGISFTAPHYFKPSSVHQLAACCIEVANAAPSLPFYYYHIPVLTGVRFPMYVLLQALEGRLPNFAGIKYTDEDLADFSRCIHYANGKYEMLWGRDECLLAAMAVGAQSGIGSTYNYAMPLYIRLMEAFRAGDLEVAGMHQQKAIEMIALLGKYGGIATGKSFMKAVGLDCGNFRLPVSNMPEGEWDHFAMDLQNIGFDDFKSK